MAETIQLRPANGGIYHAPDLSSNSASRTMSLLQRNHKDFHIFWNDLGYHNHQVHFLLTAYALGAGVDRIQHAFDANTAYQRPNSPPNEDRISKLEDDSYFLKLLGKKMGEGTYFSDFRTFFERKMLKEGWQKVFEQPAIIAEALAQAACHTGFFAKFFFEAEQIAREQPSEKEVKLIDLFNEVRQHPELWDKQHWRGGDNLDDEILSNAPQKLIEIAAKWQVTPTDLDIKTAEMYNVNAYAAGAAQYKPKEVKIDFFLMHQVNLSIFYPVLNQQSWLSLENKARLLEWKGRIDLINYASRLSPELHEDEIITYKAKDPSRTTWESIFQKAHMMDDDGHIVKLLRALAYGSSLSAPYEMKEELSDRFPLKGKNWIQIGNMAVDTTVSDIYPQRFIRGAGNPEKWAIFRDR
ncbi:uncharacterized protein A1O9_11487 [Exophiala aquamarina CBS 119918]|uniref:HypA protein n=1 Tax=Exophiala aquamarina CBS 119918 TaxID=1182545 RepID=A0A072NXV8_9EURO|nr:uncharacterized protein A1O9_11487 [Exophiala aquamarina CBS 119918]KEF52247.1 hypothetical protein A1O9_11487 [Exophiala aquamarina CBS 119918]